MISKKELYNKAKEAYYNGEPIMSDHEFDKLEAELGLENKGQIGTIYSPNYTVEHPFFMGSLSKVQVHADKNGDIDWKPIVNSVIGRVGSSKIIASPKYDGCSFEMVVKHGKVKSISTRGDGFHGKDIYGHLASRIDRKLVTREHEEYVIRGEVLIKKSVFNAKWKDKFANPRSFVAGTLNAEYNKELIPQINDLDIVCYDYRFYDESYWKGSYWHDKDFPKLYEFTKSPTVCNEYIYERINEHSFKTLYYYFDKLKNDIDYCLDGFVIKKIDEDRKWCEDSRPSDCVAIKFIPQTEPTKVVDIIWELGKTGEYFPTVIYNPVEMDGKVCTKASGHNIDWLMRKGVCVGSEIVISLAGDIIPYIYKVTKAYDRTTLSDYNVPDKVTLTNGHLMANMTEEEIRIEKFRNSCRTLGVPGLGDAQINKLIEGVKAEVEGDEFFGIEEIPFPISIFGVGAPLVTKIIGGKLGVKIGEAYENILRNMRLEDFIASLNFRFCGKKVSHEIAMKLLDRPYDFTSMAEEGYSWINDFECQNWKDFEIVCDYINLSIKDWDEREKQYENSGNTVNSGIEQKIPIIMTGEPNEYATKGEFLKAHPEYRETTSWKEVKIVFTNSLESNTGKMKKAREKGIEIKIY